ncbi:MAG: Lrp/AsnC family transcriptional regulator [Rikenellaceae bacterium]
MENFSLDTLDYKILGLITDNARISFLEVARICNVSGAAVHQRVQRLINNDVITGSVFKINTPKIGYETCAFVYLDFNPEADLNAITDKIAKIPEVTECHHTTGSYDLLIKVYAHNNNHLHQIIQEKIKPLGLVRSESTISYREIYCRQVIIQQD